MAGTALTLSGEGLNETLMTTIRSFTFSDDECICADGLLPFQTSILDMIEAVLQGQGEVNYIGFEVLFELILPPLSGFGMIYTGSSDNDVCTGYITDDSFTCGEGDDLGQLSPGDDIFDMGPGFDTLDGSLCTQPVVLDGPLGSCNFGSNTCSFTGVEAFIGSDHGDILQAGGGIILLDGADGNDLITGSGPGGSSVAGGLAAGDETLIGGAGNDTIEAGDGADLVQGGADDDSLEGGFGNDKLFGEDGADTLSGDGNDDTVDGGLGGDVLEGGTAVIVDGAGRVELRNVAFADVGVGLAYSAEDFIF